MLPTTESQIDAFLAAFESGTLPKECFTHAAHIFTGACYVHRMGEAAAIHHMRRSICSFNESVGGKNTETAGYHETITIFWIKLLNHLLRSPSTDQPPPRATFATLAVKQFASDRTLLSRFYDFDVVASQDARRTWIPPNLANLEDVGQQK